MAVCSSKKFSNKRVNSTRLGSRKLTVSISVGGNSWLIVGDGYGVT